MISFFFALKCKEQNQCSTSILLNFYTFHSIFSHYGYNLICSKFSKFDTLNDNMCNMNKYFIFWYVHLMYYLINSFNSVNLIASPEGSLIKNLCWRLCIIFITAVLRGHPLITSSNFFGFLPLPSPYVTGCHTQVMYHPL